MAVGAEILNARLSAGSSQRAAGASVGMSHAQFGRIERGDLSGVTIEQLARAASAVGLRLVVRVYPAADAVLDEPQLRLLERLRVRLPSGSRYRTEVGLPLPGDLRAWDAVVDVGGGQFAVEAESRIRDLQALARRLALKQRDGAMGVVVLLVNDTAANRAVLAEHHAALSAQFPLDGRSILRALAAGRTPTRNGILVL